MWNRPWRWGLALLAAVVVIGLGNEAIQAAGGSRFFGIPTLARLAVLLAMTALLNAFVLPSEQEAENVRAPLPPLPTSANAAGSTAPDASRPSGPTQNGRVLDSRPSGEAVEREEPGRAGGGRMSPAS